MIALVTIVPNLLLLIAASTSFDLRILTFLFLLNWRKISVASTHIHMSKMSPLHPHAKCVSALHVRVNFSARHEKKKNRKNETPSAFPRLSPAVWTDGRGAGVTYRPRLNSETKE